MKIRLNKAISDTGFCSRREADNYIEQGRVSINGVDATIGAMVEDSDSIEIDGESIRSKRKKKKEVVIYALNKPKGIACSTDLKVADNIAQYIKSKERLFVVGKIDKSAEGIVFLTNDSDWYSKLTSVETNVEKEFVVTLSNDIKEEVFPKLVSPIKSSEVNFSVKLIGQNALRIITNDTVGPQFKKRCSELGLQVIKIKRVKFMGIKTDKIPLGAWRPLTEVELGKIEDLFQEGHEQKVEIKRKQKESKFKAFRARGKSRDRD